MSGWMNREQYEKMKGRPTRSAQFTIPLDELMRRNTRPCPRCEKPFAMIAEACPDCMPKVFRDRCPVWSPRTEPFDDKGDLGMTINGFWVAKEECRACSNCLVWKKKKGAYDREAYRVHCTQNRPCLDEGKAAKCMIEETHIPPPPPEEAKPESRMRYQPTPSKKKRGHRGR